MSGRFKLATVLLATLPALNSCTYDQYPYYDARTSDSVELEMEIMTRSVQSDNHTFETGGTWENQINFAGGDYRIYFFTNDKDDASATSDNEKNTLIAEFRPRDISSVDGTTYTKYTLLGDVEDDISAYSDFKVVVLANWGLYPTVTVGSTTIDALVEGDNSTFSANTFLTSGVDSSNLIPFFGVREYSGVEWRKGWRTYLNGNINLLRALAKVEVVLSEDSDVESLDSVSIVRYNGSGYCAPRHVYVRSDYDNDYSWEEGFTDGLHLVGDRNGADGGTASFIRQSGIGFDTWTVYLPEYDNMGDDYCYMEVVVDGETFPIYFANYTDGNTTAYGDGEKADMPDRYSVFRNCLYRFYVTATINEKEVDLTIRVHVDKWEACFDNEYVFDIVFTSKKI